MTAKSGSRLFQATTQRVLQGDAGIFLH